MSVDAFFPELVEPAAGGDTTQRQHADSLRVCAKISPEPEA